MVRKTFIISLTTALCAIFLIRSAATEVVHIPDANLRAAINKTLNKKIGGCCPHEIRDAKPDETKGRDP